MLGSTDDRPRQRDDLLLLVPTATEDSGEE